MEIFTSSVPFTIRSSLKCIFGQSCDDYVEGSHAVTVTALIHKSNWHQNLTLILYPIKGCSVSHVGYLVVISWFIPLAALKKSLFLPGWAVNLSVTHGCMFSSADLFCDKNQGSSYSSYTLCQWIKV